jgi:hypothetical protein
MQMRSRRAGCRAHLLCVSISGRCRQFSSRGSVDTGPSRERPARRPREQLKCQAGAGTAGCAGCFATARAVALSVRSRGGTRLAARGALAGGTDRPCRQQKCLADAERLRVARQERTDRRLASPRLGQPALPAVPATKTPRRSGAFQSCAPGTNRQAIGKPRAGPTSAAGRAG